MEGERGHGLQPKQIGAAVAVSVPLQLWRVVCSAGEPVLAPVQELLVLKVAQMLAVGCTVVRGEPAASGSQ